MGEQTEGVNSEEAKLAVFVEGTNKIVPMGNETDLPKKYMTRVIGPGWGARGYYSEKVLREAVSNGVFSFGMHSYVDHASPEEMRYGRVRSVRDQLGILSEDSVYDENGPEGPGVYAPLFVFESQRQFVKDRAKSTGISMNVLCRYHKGEIEGRTGNIVEEMIQRPTNSVDMVSVAGAGGKFGVVLEAHENEITELAEEQSEDVPAEEPAVDIDEDSRGLTEEEKDESTQETTQEPIEESTNTENTDEIKEEKEMSESTTNAGIVDDVTRELFESERTHRKQNEQLSNQLVALQIENLCVDELNQHPIMNVTRLHLAETLPEKVMKEDNTFNEYGELQEGNVRAFVESAVDAHLRYLEALDHERTQGYNRFEPVSSGNGTSSRAARGQNPIQEAFQALGYSEEQAKSAFS